MNIDEFIAQDQRLIEELARADDKQPVLEAAMARGNAALAEASSLADQIDITARLAATAALGAADSPDLAEQTVIWAARCGRLLLGPAAEAHYLPRLAALVGAAVPHLDADKRQAVVSGMGSWLARAGSAIEAVVAAEADGDAWARVSLAATGVEGAEQIATDALQKAEDAYKTAGGLRD
ncbi:MAG: hypothetical protein KJN71_01280 [Acidimicrobiia bacterium]|nr:hypothetical protein [Acidimicrobiia bacterium]NNC74757.1 hypothetical protein [Acidimicrobiia bacterium]